MSIFSLLSPMFFFSQIPPPPSPQLRCQYLCKGLYVLDGDTKLWYFVCKTLTHWFWCRILKCVYIFCARFMLVLLSDHHSLKNEKVLERRPQQEEFHNLVQKLKQYHYRFRQYFRRTVVEFKALSGSSSPEETTVHTNYSKTISDIWASHLWKSWNEFSRWIRPFVKRRRKSQFSNTVPETNFRLESSYAGFEWRFLSIRIWSVT